MNNLENKNFYEVIIIGAGASGIMCALNIKNKSVLLIEKEEKIGKKILVTGNGRCNLTNKNISSKFYNTNLVEKYFKKFNNNNLIDFANSIGLETYFDEEGRCYPVSNYASSVLDCFRFSLEKCENVNILTNNEVVNINKVNNEYTVKTKYEEFSCNTLVISMGGNFNKMFNFNLEYNKFLPSLCALKTEKNKGLNGVKQKNALVKLIQNNTENSEIGEVLFKDNALSGICVFNLSNKYIDGMPAKFVIDFLPNTTVTDLTEKLKERCKIFNNAIEIFTSLLHKSISLNIFEKANINASLKSSQLTPENLNNLAKMVKSYCINIVGRENNNQIHLGGVPLAHLNENLMHNNFNNLYIVGEACDVAGICGGYNLQWAFTSGFIAGNEISNK